MEPLALPALAPVTFSALNALRPVQIPATPAIKGGKTSDNRALSVQDLTQGLFQQSLQAATLSALTEPATGSIGLAAQASTSLLAALTAPQAAADATPTPDATSNPTAVQAPHSTSAPAAVPPATVGVEPAVAQEALATGASADFALQTALRFGAGVAGQATLAPRTSDLATGLVRGAAAVPRLGNLEAHGGGPGPEAFARPQSANQRFLRSYDANPVDQRLRTAGQVDLLA